MIQFDRLKLKQQLALLITIAILMMLLIQLGYYYRFHNLTKERAKVYASNMMNQVEENLNTSIEKMEQGAYAVSYNRHVQEYLSTNDPQRKLVELYPFILDVLEYVKSSDGNIYDIMLINREGKLITNLYDYQYDIFQALEDKYQFTKEEFKAPVHTSLVMDPDQPFCFYAYIFPVISSTPKLDLFDKIGTVLIICKTLPLENMVSDIALTSGSLFFILDKENKIITSNDANIQGQVFDEIPLEDGSMKEKELERKYKGRNSIVQYKTIKNAEWKIVSIIPVNELMSDMQQIKTFGLLLGVIMVILLLAIGLIFIHNITKPVSQLVSFMEQIGDQNLQQRLKDPAPNEIGMIAEYVNKMLDKIENITNKVLTTQTTLYETELAKKQAELSALQSQINPHFLYNALNCISSIGLANNIMEIADISSAMSRIFRYCVKGGGLVSIREEIDCIKDYLSVMNIRYGGKFTATMDIEGRILEKKTLKMILQPIVENAICHGLAGKIGKGCLIIQGKLTEDRYISFQICDDGKGMEESELAALQQSILETAKNGMESFNAKAGIGLANIHNRIQLYFGKEYGLRIESRLGEGTQVFVRFPVMTEEILS